MFNGVAAHLAVLNLFFSLISNENEIIWSH